MSTSDISKYTARNMASKEIRQVHLKLVLSNLVRSLLQLEQYNVNNISKEEYMEVYP